MHEVLVVLEQWCTSAGLKVSAAKTQWIDLGKRSSVADMTIDGVEIKRSKSVKFLSLFISRDMKWREHLGYLRTQSILLISDLFSTHRS